MGLLMLAAGAFFATTGLKTLLKNRPYLASDIEWLVALLLIVAAGIVVLVGAEGRQVRRRARVVRGGRSGSHRGAVLGMNNLIETSRTDYEQRQRLLAEASAGGEARVVSGVWLEFSEAGLQQALDQGKAVFVDFTADWCVTCKAFKKTVLEPEPVKSRLRGRCGDLRGGLTARRSSGS